MSKKVNLKGLFNDLQGQMSGQLKTIKHINHGPTKGDASENVWIKWLRDYLPNRYNVDKAIIIDSTGSVSEQIDLVIYDQQYTPFVLTQNDIKYIPAEGVYAVFEIKPDLKGTVEIKKKSYNHIEYAGRKIESVRKLKRTSTKIIDVGFERDARPLTKIIGGILTRTNNIKQKKTIEKHLKSLSGLQSIEMGCAIGYGSFFVEYHGDYKTQRNISHELFNSNIRDYYNKRKLTKVNYSESETALVTFFLQLLRYLQQSIGTVAAIDLNEYSKAINYKIDKEI